MTSPLRVLLIEDSPTDAKLVVQELRRGGRAVEFARVETPDEMRAALRTREWNIVISDWSLPAFSAPLALAVLRETGLELPFIIVSGTIGEETAVEAMQAGADDFVLKDKLGRLVPAVDREIREFEEREARRRVEQALRESESRFRKLSDSGIIGIATTDVGGNILDANDAYLKLFGYTREELLGGEIRWDALTPPEFSDLAARAVEQLRTSGIATPWETEAFRKDGSRVPVLVGAAMLEYPKCIAFVADLTERRRAEDAEEALRHSEEQLRQAQKMEAVGRLAGGVAHDFNNALSVILSYGELMRMDLTDGEPMCADLDEVLKAAKQAAGLTRQLLLFSRQQPAEAKIVDLNDVLSSMDKMLRRLLGEDVDLLFVPAKSIGRVRVDRSHIEQVIMNLVVNARDAMPTGGKLTIETGDIDLDEEYAQTHLPARTGPHVMLAVTDTGHGMDRATQTRIFEPFFTTKETGKGTGLGLSTVFGIVQQSGGNIWVYSEPRKGTTFKVYLPLVEGALDLSRPRPEPTTLRGTETVLVVEDEEQVRAVALNVLRRNGYEVVEARNAEEARSLCETHTGPIHLLLTDVVMPQMSGPELAKHLATLRPDMKVLCMSGYTDDSVVRHGVLTAELAFLQKPLTPASLTRKVREVLDAVPSHTESSPKP